MKFTTRLISAALLVFSGTAVSANFYCTDFGCNIEWKANSSGIILGSVCQDYRYKPEYKACKKAAKEVFVTYCDTATRHNNRIQQNLYCSAARNFRP